MAIKDNKPRKVFLADPKDISKLIDAVIEEADKTEQEAKDPGPPTP